jgi:hypothetical protein
MIKQTIDNLLAACAQLNEVFEGEAIEENLSNISEELLR